MKIKDVISLLEEIEEEIPQEIGGNHLFLQGVDWVRTHTLAAIGRKKRRLLKQMNTE